MLFVEHWSRLNIPFLRLHWVFIASAGFLWVQHVLVNHPQSFCCNSSSVKRRCKARYAKRCSGWRRRRGSTLPTESSCWVCDDRSVLVLLPSDPGKDPGTGKFSHPTPEYLFAAVHLCPNHHRTPFPRVPWQKKQPSPYSHIKVHFLATTLAGKIWKMPFKSLPGRKRGERGQQPALLSKQVGVSWKHQLMICLMLGIAAIIR